MSETTTRSRVRTRLALGLVLLFLALVAGRVLWFRHEYGSWNPFDYPDRFTVNGRTYYPSTEGPHTTPPGRILTRADIGIIWMGDPSKVGSVGPIPFLPVGRHDIYAASGPCVTTALLRLDENRYGLYDLAGGC